MRHRHHRQARCRHARQIAKQRAAPHKLFHLVGHQVGARALHQLHIGQLVFKRQLLHAQLLVQPHGLQGARVDAGVRRAHHAANARHHANACNHAPTGHALVQVGHVQPQPGQRTEFEKRGARVQQQGHPLAWQQLLAFFKPLARRRRLVHAALLIGAHTVQQGQHAAAVGLKRVAADGQRGVDM